MPEVELAVVEEVEFELEAGLEAWLVAEGVAAERGRV